MKRNKEKSIKKILQVAENLFSNVGFDATSVDLIAKKSNVNKALIYYYFKNKDDLVQTLFANILKDLKVHMDENKDTKLSVKEKLKHEINYIESKKNIISVLLMESMKNNNNATVLFKLTEELSKNESKKKKLSDSDYIFEFFTGIMPLLSFVVFKDKWLKHFKCSQEVLEDKFIEHFTKSHLSNH